MDEARIPVEGAEVDMATDELSKGSCTTCRGASGLSETAKSFRIGAGELPAEGLVGGEAAEMALGSPAGGGTDAAVVGGSEGWT